MPADGRRDWILAMLRRADRADPERKAPGARFHQYRLNPPADADRLREAEQKYGFTLPEDYFWFLTTVGDGGAGPYRGLLPFENDQRIMGLDHLGEAALFGPMESPQAYEAFIRRLPPAETAGPKLWRGLLTIGRTGGTQDAMLVVTGDRRGCVMLADQELKRPYYSVDASFLDWYARWLEETAAGYNMHFFDSRIGGNASELTARYETADEEEKALILEALFKFPSMEKPVLRRLAKLHEKEENQDFRNGLMRHLFRLQYEKADGLLREALRHKESRLQALVALWGRYVREPQPEHWYREILDILPMEEDSSQTGFRMALDLITKSPVFHMEDLEPLIMGCNEEQQAILFAKCSPRAMPLHTALCYVGKLEDSCRGSDPKAIETWLGRCARIYYRNPSLQKDLGRVLRPICLTLQEALDSGKLRLRAIRESIDLILGTTDPSGLEDSLPADGG